MGVNPVLERLGFSRNERVVIFHVDDVGMCQATLGAYAELVEFGLVSSAATMVPCPWFPAAAAGREMQWQIERALAAGIDVTHIDSHMFTIYHPKLLPVYLDLARQYRIPLLMLRSEEQMLRLDAYDRETTAAMARLVKAAEVEGLPFVDDIVVMPLVFPVENRLAYARRVLQGLSPGITCFIIHPTHDTPELRAMAPDWRSRVGDYYLFLSEAWREAVRQSGVQVIGYRVLRQLIVNSGQ